MIGSIFGLSAFLAGLVVWVLQGWIAGLMAFLGLQFGVPVLAALLYWTPDPDPAVANARFAARLGQVRTVAFWGTIGVAIVAALAFG